MFANADSDEDTKPTSLPDAHLRRLKYIDVVPLTKDTDGPCTTDCDSGDWSAQVKQEKLTVVKQEPVNVRCTVLCNGKNLLVSFVVQK